MLVGHVPVLVQRGTTSAGWTKIARQRRQAADESGTAVRWRGARI